MKFKKGDIVMWKRGEVFDRCKLKIVDVNPASGIWDYIASNFESTLASTYGFHEHELVEENKARLLILAGKVQIGLFTLADKSQLSEEAIESDCWLSLQGKKEE